ncbi:MAG TPA: NAD(P)-binding protein [Streptosporangiaceae bacterium]|jgi:phytoene dehydrogenase-like protein|nr:NAD(P)-binding protein [Streptosporangiaceae bacterium]
MSSRRDAVVVGGGHNGLVAAAYLARNGMDTLVCERRETVGGAAVSEHPFGPGYTVTSLSYVVSLLPPDLVRDLRLEQHGYHVYPQGPYFAPRADGRCLRLPADRAERHAQIARFSRRDADSYDAYDAHLAAIGRVLAPLLLEAAELPLGQMFHARPAAGYADLRTPVRGLYQAGSATHGGGGVTGIPGRNVVRQILADRRAQRWADRWRYWAGLGHAVRRKGRYAELP